MSNIKSYLGIAKDHSSSMSGIAKPALADYNSKIESIKSATIANSQDTILSVVEFDSYVRRTVTNSNIVSVKPDTTYKVGGMTALWDAVGDLITQFEAMPDANDPNVSFLIMAITDGAENASNRWSASKLATKIRTLTNTDRWTFVFRTPRGYKSQIMGLGIPEGNIQEWDQNTRGVEVAAVADTQAFTQYFATRSAGATSTNKFYTDLSNVSVKDVKQTLTDISTQVVILNTPDTVQQIRPFVEARLGTYKTGAAFYLLTKTETVQANKKIIIHDKKDNKFYGGHGARGLLGLPEGTSIKLVPGDHKNFNVYIQSTSVNRNLMPNSTLCYYDKF